MLGLSSDLVFDLEITGFETAELEDDELAIYLTSSSALPAAQLLHNRQG